MDRERFDGLTRLLEAHGSRRSALGAVLAAALLGASLDGEAKKKKGKKKNNRPKTCFGTEICEFPGPGLDFENCDFFDTDVCANGNCSGSTFRRADLGSAILEDGNFQGVSFRNANLRNANLEDADVSGASFRDACLVGANFRGANTDGAHFGGAIFCNTTLPNGDVDDSGCGDGTACCPTEVEICVPLGDECDSETDICCEGVCDVQGFLGFLCCLENGVVCDKFGSCDNCCSEDSCTLDGGVVECC